MGPDDLGLISGRILLLRSPVALAPNIRRHGKFTAVSTPSSPNLASSSGPWGSVKELWTIAWPTVLTMTSYTIMQFTDGLMVSYVGPTEFNAQNNGGMLVFVPISFVMGMLTLVNTYVSQNLGAGTPERGPKYAWASFWMACATWLCMLVLAGLLPWIFSLTSHSEELQRLETLYGQILVVGSILTIGSRGLSHFFYGMHRPKVVFVATFVGNIVNILANYALIFGKFGFPEMGLMGAAIGTIIGTFVEFTIPAAVFLGPKMNAEFRTRAAWRPEWKPIKQLLKLGWPKGIQFSNEMACWAIFMVVLVGNMFGEAEMAAGWIVLKYMHLSFMPTVGISVAITAVVGRYIGAKAPEVAVKRAWTGVGMAMVYMGFCAACFVIFREPMVELFVNLNDRLAVDSPEAAAEAALMREKIVTVGTKLLICAAIFQLFDAIAITTSGALSGAGDTVWPGVVTVITSWTLIVGLGWTLAVMFPEWGAVGPWIGAATFIIVLGILLLWRWMSGRWRSIKLLDDDDDASTPPVDPGTGLEVTEHTIGVARVEEETLMPAPSTLDP